ncbi:MULTISPECIES: DUF1673 family protein [Methanosarcina]|uniref:Uncharacterized protein n=3 Tax=Methanosarcina barkeri TaxID=2208 RepID=A0A0E3QX90_METBA|nr:MULTISPECIES: DUF1673 family protein [Methanosarcina]AKB56397.1 hypothetical protein MSBRM_3399 [Methanosarcina barkeri MS]AKB59868.1 hypothetical protein MSBR2_3352 [Methanosarcina barkeri 227]AKJ40520.1 hypothetical protein MCM1_3537 [Methanosarcina barkeri CM1]OEC91315.1 hypothetical protein A9239_03230 [Methanosarcina sp. A14]
MSRESRYINKLMGWCPVCKNMVPKIESPFISENLIPASRKTGNLPEPRTSNVVFPANISLIMIFLMTSFNLLLLLKYLWGMPLFLAVLFLLSCSCYLLALKTYDSAVLVDEVGVHLQAFIFKKLILYNNIKSVTVTRINKKSKKIYIPLIILGFATCGFLSYMAVVKGEWNIFLLFVSLFPFVFITEWKQKTRFWNGNTRLHIKTRHKKWHKWTWASYNSMITDEASATEIKSSIERHL